MAPQDLRTLRQKAKAAGIRGFKGMDRDELIAALKGSSGSTRPTKKRSTSAPAKKRTRSTTTRTRSTAKRQTSGRKPARKPAAKPKAQTRTRQASRNSNGDAGRNLLGKINWSDTEGWNARPGSPRDEIQKALRKAKGNRDSVFNTLVKRIRDFVPLRKADGSKRTKAEQEAYLRYLISRVAFDFAVKTGQHEPSANRATYGEGGTGTGAFQRRNNKRRAPAASKPKRTTKRTTAKRGPGRPKGSKNKRRATARR